MRVALITRSTLHSTPGGDTTQVEGLAAFLRQLGVQADVIPADRSLDYNHYQLLHFFNITRPSDILRHIKKTNKPFAVTPILIDYSEFEKKHRRGIAGFFLRFFSPDMIEYFKAIGRVIRGNDKMLSADYILKGHRGSIQYVLKKASLLLPNSSMEYKALAEKYKAETRNVIIPTGIDPTIFCLNIKPERDNTMVICAARIEGLKNQSNLIKALNNTRYQLLLIGSAAPNHLAYYNYCKKIAGPNVSFIDHLPQKELLKYYSLAKVHVLPSWFETCGLSSMEAAAMGCNIVITDKGYTRSFYGDEAFYCDPASPASIFEAVEKAANASFSQRLFNTIHENYNMQAVAVQTREVYELIAEQ